MLFRCNRKVIRFCKLAAKTWHPPRDRRLPWYPKAITMILRKMVRLAPWLSCLLFWLFWDALFSERYWAGIPSKMAAAWRPFLTCLYQSHVADFSALWLVWLSLD